MSARDNAFVLQVVTPTVYAVLFIKFNVQCDLSPAVYGH